VIKILNGRLNEQYLHTSVTIKYYEDSTRGNLKAGRDDRSPLTERT
jgi:hypothetical protein